MADDKHYVALREFSAGGRDYRAGDDWLGSDEEAEQQVAAGNLRSVVTAQANQETEPGSAHQDDDGDDDGKPQGGAA